MKTTHLEPDICCCTCFGGEDAGDALCATAANTAPDVPEQVFCCCSWNF